jgi:hypothetical protein
MWRRNVTDRPVEELGLESATFSGWEEGRVTNALLQGMECKVDIYTLAGCGRKN